MKIANNLKQNTKEWYAWRAGGLGASDAPAIMGVSPYTSRFELWLEKTGMAKRPAAHPRAIEAMTRGKLLEDEARKCYETMTGGSLYAALNVMHPVHDFIRASLDGYNEKKDRIVEIKCPGKVDLAKAGKGRVPKKYLPQVQLQLLVTGAVACDYFTYDGHGQGIIVEVLPDKDYQQKLEQEMIAFWGLVQTKTCPLLDAGDVLKYSRALDEATFKLKVVKEVFEFAERTLAEQKGESNAK